MSDLRELLEARRAMANRACQWGGDWTAVDGTTDPDIGSWWVSSGRGNVTYEPLAAIAEFIAANDPATVTLLLDLALAAERLAAYDGSSAGAYLGLVEDMRATLDRLAAHLRGGAA